MALKIPALALFLCSVFQPSLATFGPEESPSTLQTPCPDPQDIDPCTCSITAPWKPDLDCSQVQSSEELRGVFNQSFEDPHFHFFMAQNTRGLRRLEGGTFGEATFKSFFFLNGDLEVVEPNVFLGSRGFLQYLTLDRQNLTTFPYEEISQHGILRTLSFSGNRISAFPTLESSSLESLDLSFNPISDIPADGLAGLPYLFDFTCEDCGLTEINPGTFAGRKRLSGLILRSNNLTHLPENMVQSDYYSVGILVEDNQISNVSAGAFKLGPGQNMHVNLANNRLEQLEERVWRPYFEGGLTYLMQRVTHSRAGAT
ncbi:oplophorus-luciferin 2-monooxygenase non-catalytic subunit-like [Macrobrachium nipponense]|uniref:oplophorus-luciferin 2-monooxygenase non-catalytic subunit-like n=1 Tax=Macrobrachium nipponense TaxID=159736 RepID=UPI0030C804EF